jgi:hypothetical protein
MSLEKKEKTPSNEHRTSLKKIKTTTSSVLLTIQKVQQLRQTTGFPTTSTTTTISSCPQYFFIFFFYKFFFRFNKNLKKKLIIFNFIFKNHNFSFSLYARIKKLSHFYQQPNRNVKEHKLCKLQMEMLHLIYGNCLFYFILFEQRFHAIIRTIKIKIN